MDLFLVAIADWGVALYDCKLLSAFAKGLVERVSTGNHEDFKGC